MAGGLIGSGPSGKNYPGRLTCRVFITCMVAAFGGLIFGYDLGISGTNVFIHSVFGNNNFCIYLCLVVLFINDMKMCMCRWCDFYGSFSEEILPSCV